MSISRSRNVHQFRYMMNDFEIARVNKFKDLGVIFDSKMSFREDITYRTAKARSILGLIKRHSCEFSDPSTLKCLYNALVRSRLEYGSQVWSPIYSGASQQIERVQRSFLKFIDQSSQLNYEQLCQKHRLLPLETRRQIASIMLCFDLMTGKTDCPELLSQLNFHCPMRIFRNNEFFRTSRHATNYAQSSSFNIMCKNFNDISHLFDFNLSRDVFKNLITRELGNLNWPCMLLCIILCMKRFQVFLSSLLFPGQNFLGRRTSVCYSH